MYCQNCGVEVSDNTTICPQCGYRQAPLTTETPYASYEMVDTGHIGWGILGFLIPIVGLILFLVWHDSEPKTARMAGKGALVRVIVTAAVVVLVTVLSIVFGIGVSLWRF